MSLRETLVQLNRRFENAKAVQEEQEKQTQIERDALTRKNWRDGRLQSIPLHLTALRSNLEEAASKGQHFIEIQENEWMWHDCTSDPVYDAYVLFAKENELKFFVDPRREYCHPEDKDGCIYHYARFEW